MMPPMRPIISYYGGKARMAHNIVPLLPPHTVYVEPFCGGGAIFWAKGIPKHGNNNDYREVLNDTDGRLINFYRVMQAKDSREALLDRLNYTPYSQAEHKLAKEQADGPDSLQRAWSYTVLTMQSFGKKYKSGWGTAVYSANHAATWQQWLRYLNKAAPFERLQYAYLEDADWSKCIVKWDSPQTLFYCDPPYVGTEQGQYAGWTQANRQELLDTLDSIQGSFVLSEYPSDDMPAPWQRVEFTRRCQVDQGRVGNADKSKRTVMTPQTDTRTECVWIMDRSHTTQRPDLRRLMGVEPSLFHEVA